MEHGALKGISTDEELVSKNQVKEFEKRVHQLERILEKKTLENKILREGTKTGHEKKLISRQPLIGLKDLESVR